MPKSKRPGYNERWFITQMELYPAPEKVKPKPKEEDDNLLLIIIAGSAGVLILFGAIIIIYLCCCKGKKTKTTKVKKESKRSKKVNPESSPIDVADNSEDPAIQFVINAKQKQGRQGDDVVRMETMWQRKDSAYNSALSNRLEIDTLLVNP